MKKRWRHLILVSFVLCFHLSNYAQQNWLNYFDIVNKAEEEFVDYGNYNQSLKLYDSAFQVYKNTYVNDLYVAAEIAFYSKDFFRFKNTLTLDSTEE